MATKVARLNGPHSAGIFADMTIDGPEIGTLVMIVDRAKNLPNKKTMGKQNPYCAARLGKDAQKTETDKRGGQTPRWDQELRFTVHDSPDYYNLKISVFSEDKRTDLIGEAWVNLTDVIVPGGGKSDLWQGLNCKGKYAGELRIELTYYDSRQKPEKVAETATAEEDTRVDLVSGKVKRRPLPQNPNVPSTTPVVIPERPLPGRARHGPRNFHTPPRSNSMPSQELSYPHSQTTLMVQNPVQEALTSSSAPPIEHDPPKQYIEELPQVLRVNPHVQQQPGMPQPADFLPQLAPSGRRASAMAPQQYSEPVQAPAHSPAHRVLAPPSHDAAIQHSHSAPSVPMVRPDHRGYEDVYQPTTEYPERAPRNEHHYRLEHPQSSSVPPSWDHGHGDPYSDKQVYQEVEPVPPPPPVHSNSAPAVPHYSPQHAQTQHSSRYEATPPRSSQQYIQNTSPLQNIERSYGLPQPAYQQEPPPSSSHHHYHNRHSAKEPSMDSYDRSPVHHGPGYMSAPPDSSPVQMSSPYDRMPSSQQLPPQHGAAEPYTAILRPHPLSQEVSRNQVPDPYQHEAQPGAGIHSYGREPRERRSWVQDAPPLIKPRAISPTPLPVSSSSRPQQPTPPHHPPQPLQEQQPQAKAYTPRNSYSIQFPVRAFESSDESPLAVSRNPPPPPQGVPARKSVSPRPSMSGNSSSATPFSPDSFDVHNPSYQIQPSSLDASSGARNGPIVDWDGNEIHPSDHLPVDSWAPEPEQKLPSKTYGLGRDRDFGPRAPQGVPTSTGRISKDTIINFRRKKDQEKPDPMPATVTVRSGRLQKPRPDQGHAEPPRARVDHDRGHHPYTQPRYSRSFTEDTPGMNEGRAYRQDGYAPPSIPPKLPIQHAPEYDRDVLSREIANIDIGSSRNRLSQSAVAYVPVRSHRDRNSFY